jgi:hypothetical protein
LFFDSGNCAAPGPYAGCRISSASTAALGGIGRRSDALPLAGGATAGERV